MINIKEKIYQLDYNKLSNDKLLELFFNEVSGEEELLKMEKILKQREVIKEVNNNEDLREER